MATTDSILEKSQPHTLPTVSYGNSDNEDGAFEHEMADVEKPVMLDFSNENKNNKSKVQVGTSSRKRLFLDDDDDDDDDLDVKINGSREAQQEEKQQEQKEQNNEQKNEQKNNNNNRNNVELKNQQKQYHIENDDSSDDDDDDDGDEEFIRQNALKKKQTQPSIAAEKKKSLTDGQAKKVSKDNNDDDDDNENENDDDGHNMMRVEKKPQNKKRKLDVETEDSDDDAQEILNAKNKNKNNDSGGDGGKESGSESDDDDDDDDDDADLEKNPNFSQFKNQPQDGCVLAMEGKNVPSRSRKGLRLLIQFPLPISFRKLLSRALNLQMERLPLRIVKKPDFTGIVVVCMEGNKVGLLYSTFQMCKIVFYDENGSGDEDENEEISFCAVIGVHAMRILYGKLSELSTSHVVDMMMYSPNNAEGHSENGFHVDCYVNDRELNEDRLFIPLIEPDPLEFEDYSMDFTYDYRIDISTETMQKMLKKAISNQFYNTDVIRLEVLTPISKKGNKNLNVLVLKIIIDSENGKESKKIVSISETTQVLDNEKNTTIVSVPNQFCDPSIVADKNLQSNVSSEFNAARLYKFLQNMRADNVQLHMSNGAPILITYPLDGSDSNSYIKYLLAPKEVMEQ